MSTAGVSRIDCLGVCTAVLGILLTPLLGCGGGGGTTPIPTPAPGDFTISVTPADLSLKAGGSETATVSIAEVNTFTAAVNVSASGLPTGVIASPATFSLTPGSQQLVTLTAGATSAGTATISFQGVSGSLSHSAQASLTVIAMVTGTHAPIRPRYLRTNSFYDPNSLQFAPPHFSVYDSVHKRFFVSNPYMNEIDVFDATQEIETAQIPVPMAWGIDISPYNGSLYAGTLIGDVYQIDTSTLSVTTRYPSAQIGPKGFVATTALVLSDGRLALQGPPSYPFNGFSAINGYGAPVVWNAESNSLDDGNNHEGVCQSGSNGGIALSGDRTRILVTWVDSGGSGDPICSYDPIARVATYGKLMTTTGVRQIIPTPDGTRFFITSGADGVGVFDAKTVQMLGQLPPPTGPDYLELPSSAQGAVMSVDGSTLYLISNLDGSIGAYDTTSFALKGWVPSFLVYDIQKMTVISAIDETGLIVGPIGHGVGFVDASRLETEKPTMFNPQSAGFASPASGPESGGTEISGFADATITDDATLGEIYVGNVTGIEPSLAGSSGQEYMASVNTPASTLSGAVDLTTVLSDGGVSISPESFSYGPTILEVIPNGATAEGGQTGAIIGYGFGSTASAIQITVGGKPAPVTAVYDYAPVIPYPLPVNALQFVIPPGTAGSAVDVTVTTPSGSATATGAFHYTAAVESYPVAANLQAGIYDAGRDRYYFTSQAQVLVLSKSTGTWLSPIVLPGVSSSSQLLAIAQSPDGTKLAVADYGVGAIYLIDPDNPSSVNRYYPEGSPTGLAVANSGSIYFSDACSSLYELNTSTGAQTQLVAPLYVSGIIDSCRVLLSPDGSRIFANDNGFGVWVATATNQVNKSFSSSSIATAGPSEFPELAMSLDGSTLDLEGDLADTSLNSEVTIAYIDWETWFPIGVNGQKLNQDGSFLFQPLTDGIDLIARNTGRLLYRIQIPVTPASVYDPLVLAKGQNTLAVITATGVSFVDLSSLPIPSRYTQPYPAGAESRGGALADGQNVAPSQGTSLNRSLYLSAGPKLRRGLEQPQIYPKTP